MAIIKHANRAASPSAPTSPRAHRKAHACDPVSAFGGVIAANREGDLSTPEQIAGGVHQVVVAPGFTDDAVEVLTRKKNVRLLRMPEATAPDRSSSARSAGGVLVQHVDQVSADGDDPPPGRWPPARRSKPPPSTTWCSPGGRCAR